MKAIRLLFATAALSLILSVVAFANFTLPITVGFGTTYTGQGTNVGYTVYDNAGTAQIARTTSGVSEIAGADSTANTGNYTASPSINPTWLPIRIHWDITGKTGVSADTVISSFPSSVGVTVTTNNDKTGYTASTVSDKTGYSLTQTFPTNFSTLAINGSGAVTSSSVTSVATGTATAGSSNTITLAGGSSATTDLYKGNFIVITAGTGAGQSRVITGYNGGTLVATLSRSWITTPDNTSVYSVIAAPHAALDTNLAVTTGTNSDKTNYQLATGQNVATVGGLAPPTGWNTQNIDGSGNTQISMTQTLPASPTASTVGEAVFNADIPVGRRGTAQGGTSTTITLDAGASATDNVFNYHYIKLTGGTGAGQFATITGYVGATKVATITRPGPGTWSTTPDNTSVFAITPEPAIQVANNLDKTGYTASTVSDKTGYSLTQTFPPNFSSTNIDGSGRMLLQPSQPSVVIPTVTTLTSPVAVSGTVTLNTTEDTNLTKLALALTPFTGSMIDGLSTTTTVDTGLGSTDLYTGGLIVFTSGADAGVSRHISAYNTSSHVATLLTALPSAPANTDTFTIVSAGHKLTDFLAALGTDNKVILSNNAHTGAVIPTVTNVTNNVVASSVTGNVGGNIVGNVNGSVANVLAPVTVAAYSTGQDPATLVWNALATNFNTASTMGAKLNAAGTASDPWSTLIPGSYPSGTAGYILGHAPTDTTVATDTQTGLTAQGYTTARAPKLDNLDAAVSTRNATTPPTAVAIRTEIDTNSTQLAKLGTPSGVSISADIAAIPNAAANGTAAATAVLVTPAQKIATNVSNQVTVSNFPATVALSSGDEAKIGTIGNDTPGIGTLLARIPGTVQPQTGDSYARLGAPTGANIDADILTRASATVSPSWYAAASSDAAITSDVTSALNTLMPVTPTTGSLFDKVKSNLDTNVGSRMATFTYTAPPTVTAIRTEMDTNSTKLTLLDVATSTRSSASVPPSWYTAPTNADTSGVTTLLSRVTAAVALSGVAPGWWVAPPTLPSDYLSSGEQSSLTTAAGYGTNISAIKAQTDKLGFTGAGPYTVNANTTDSSGVTTLLGRVTGAVALAGISPSWFTAAPTASANASAVWTYLIDPLGSTPLTAVDAFVEMFMDLSGPFAATYPDSTHQTTVYKRNDGTTTGYTSSLVKNSSGQNVTRTNTPGTLP